MRAQDPDHEGFVERDGVKVGYEVYGAGEPTLLLVPPAPITHSRVFKALIPHLARRHRVVTCDGRGNGRSSRPSSVDAHRRAENVDDIVAVLDAEAVERAVIVAHCHANWWAVDVTSTQPERVLGLVAIAPGVPYLGASKPHWIEAAGRWDEIIDEPTGWELCNRQAIQHDLRRWVEFFFAAQLVEPHSTKPYEDAVSWAMESTGDILAASEEAPDLDLPCRLAFEQQCRDLGVPVLVIHGALDVCQDVERGRAFAELTGGDLAVLAGSGHLPHVRDPVRVNRLITDFIEENAGVSMRTTTWSRALNRPKRALYLSTPIGLGHARRDVAVAQELKRLRPDLEIDWLAQHPVTAVLEAEGESVHPASRWLANESAHIASESSEHDLHCFQALRRMDEILVANFMVFQEVVEEGLYDLVIGDEAWDVDHFWHENPELKRGQHVWLTDFVGFLPMSDGGEHEAFLTADYNAEMIEHIARYPWIRDRAVFVGNPDDIVGDRFGAALPAIRDWTEEHFAFSGYITGFTPPMADEIPAWRAELGYHDDELVCVVAVGGSGVGQALLDKVIAAYPIAKRQLPALRMVAVAGPRIDPAMFPTHAGLEVHGYVDRLYRHLCACDLAVVQGGLSTTMELAAAKRPFLYFPLAHHFEQNFHVRHRLDRYGAGQCMDYATTDPDLLAAAIVDNIGSPVTYRDVETDGAARAAELIAELV